MSQSNPFSNLPLFSDPPAPKSRETDPETSKEAAASMADEAQTQRLRILSYLRDHGPATADHLDDVLGLRLTSAGRRLPELRDMGRVEITEDRARTRSGRPARIWRALGWDEIEARERGTK